MSDKDHDIKRIEKLLEIMKANDLAELEIKRGDEKIVLRRNQPQPAIFAAPAMHAAPAGPVPASPADAQGAAGEPAAAADEGLVKITSPIVGTFYGTPSPDADPYVEAGSEVDGQTVVCIIEAMKVMNEIKAEVAGTIVEVCCKNGQAVEYGQTLFKVRPH